MRASTLLLLLPLSLWLPLATPLSFEDQANRPDNPPFDLLASIQALSHLKQVASVASSLNTLIEDDSPVEQRVRNAANTLSSPSLLASLQHIISHADKLLVPEVVDTAVNLLNATPLVSDDKRDRIISVLEAVRVLLTPKFAQDVKRARARLEKFMGVDLYSYVDSIAGGLGWVTGFFDPEYLKKVNLLVETGRKVLGSEGMRGVLAQMTDPTALEGLLGVLEKVQASMTPQRIKRIRAIAEKAGLVEMDEQARKRLGENLAAVLKGGFNEDGVKSFREFLEAVEVLLASDVPGSVGGLVQLRAMLLTPYMAEDVHRWFRETEDAVDVLPAVLGVLREVLATVAPLMDPVERAERVLNGPFSEDMGRVMQAVGEVPVRSLAGVGRWLDTTLRLLEEERVGGVRLLLADVAEILSAPRIFGGIAMNVVANASGMMGAMPGVNPLGVVDVMPALDPDVLDKVLALLGWLDTRLGPGEIEQTREQVAGLAAVVSVAVEVVEAMEDEDYEFHEEL